MKLKFGCVYTANALKRTEAVDCITVEPVMPREYAASHKAKRRNIFKDLGCHPHAVVFTI